MECNGLVSRREKAEPPMSQLGQFRPIGLVRGESGVPPKAEILLRYSEWSKWAKGGRLANRKPAPH
jgi:hypothetical protein